MHFFQLLQELHEVVNTPFLEHLKKKLGERGARLLCYKYKRSPAWAIGKWVDKDAGFVQEVFNWQDGQNLTDVDVRQVDYFCSPQRQADVEVGLRRMRAHRDREHIRHANEVFQSKERARDLAKQHEIPYHLASAITNSALV